MIKNEKIIHFPDQNPILIKHNNIIEEFSLNQNNLEFNSKNNSKNNISKTSTIISNYINFLIDNNLLPDLPSKLNIVYVRDNSFFTLDNNKNNINNVSIDIPEKY